MINTKKFVDLLIKNKINFFSGVPDSCTNNFCTEINKRKKATNIIAPNEGCAVSLGIGYNLSTKKIPCVYLQNSGLGNATDPITNLISKEIYNLPLLMIIGWRGKPGTLDEPQHVIQGKSLLKTLKSYNIGYTFLNSNKNLFRIKKILKSIKKNSLRYAIVVDKNSFAKVRRKKQKQKNYLTRYELINYLLMKINKKTKIFSSVGYNSRELYQIRKEKNFKNGKDFLIVGGMGHTFAIAISYAQNNNDQVICLDGDGSFMMHLGSFSLLNKFKKKNFKYIMIDNNSHESIGDQKINLKQINYKLLVKSLGFKKYFYVQNKSLLSINQFLKSSGPSFLHVKVKIGTLKNLYRPKNFQFLKKSFLN